MTKKNQKQTYGGGSVFQLCDGRYRAKFKGKVLYTGEDKRKAQEILDKAREQNKLMDLINQSPLQRLLNPIEHDSKWSKMTIEDFADYWFNNVWPNKRKRNGHKKVLAENTVARKKYSIDKIKNTIGHYCLSDITTEMIQTELIDYLISQNYALSVIEKCFQVANELFKYAVDTIGCINSDPMKNVVIRTDEIKEEKEIHWFTPEQIVSFTQACKEVYNNGKYIYSLGFAFIFILETGLRGGEALALKWKDIDFIKQRVQIRKQIISPNGKDKEVNYTKSESSIRWIYLNPVAIDALQKLKEIRCFGLDSYIISTKNNTRVTKRNLHTAFNKILTRAKLEPCGVHTLRHTFASILFHKNVKLETISKLLGHKNTKITSEVYIHFLQEQQFEALGKINSVSGQTDLDQQSKRTQINRMLEQLQLKYDKRGNLIAMDENGKLAAYFSSSVLEKVS